MSEKKKRRIEPVSKYGHPMNLKGYSLKWDPEIDALFDRALEKVRVRKEGK